MIRPYVSLTVSQKAEKSIKNGHPWVYADEVTEISWAYKNGDIVDVRSGKGRYLGSGFVNDNSKIRVRIISRNANDKFDEAFFERRINYSLDYRKTVMNHDFKCCRLIFGDSDGFPGLIVDRFSNVLVAQVLSYGIDIRKDMIFTLLVNALRERGETIDALYERNDAPTRSKEGLERYKDFWHSEITRDDIPGTVVIMENSIKYCVDFINGQKTGFFLDQKYNRAAAARIAHGKKVLDCFTHTGSFALNCAKAGAQSVTAVDISSDALDMAKANAKLNSLEKNMSFVCTDVFDLLTEMSSKGKCDYDYIILDPPAFTKSNSTVANAYKGYKDINIRAMKVLPRGGYLATCSCSHFMTDGLFKKMLHEAAADAGVSLRQIEHRQQSCDHPILWNVPETDYLKFYIFQIV